MKLKKLELNGFKSFAKKSEFIFDSPITAIVGPNGSGKSNVVESLSFVLGEQSMKSLRSKIGSDLIFKGSKNLSKMNRASVTITLDNTERSFHFHNEENKQISVDFDEIIISREVFLDGVNNYKLNGTDVRLKDIHELIASVNIGSSGHHIVSQGEADRYLNVNSRERKEMIEGALGLTIFHYRIKEAIRKLTRAENNLREAEILRREIAPHLRFLKKQVKKSEEAKELQEALRFRYCNFLVQEKNNLEEQSFGTKNEVSKLDEELVKISDNINLKRDELSWLEKESVNKAIKDKEQELKNLSQKKTEITNKLGRIEGMIELLEKDNSPEQQTKLAQKQIPFPEIKTLMSSILDTIEAIISGEKTKNELSGIKDKINSFLSQGEEYTNKTSIDMEQFEKLKKEHDSLFNDSGKIIKQEKELLDKIADLREGDTSRHGEIRNLEKEIFEIQRKYDSLASQKQILEREQENFESREQRLVEENLEAETLLGKHIVEQTKGEILASELDIIEEPETERREIERMKIRLEDIGGSGGVETLDEYKEVSERDEFLTKEIIDLQDAIEKMNSLISDLKKELDKKFFVGLAKINEQFQHFFSYIFGGGKAKIKVIEIIKKKSEDVEDGEGVDGDASASTSNVADANAVSEIGIDIIVSVPRKKASDINMLSGGERSLTSIALLFALSQVEPPPFLVLDEMDAALDEVNSRKYGEMLKGLAKLSQLILVTHNRETMSCADTLYGVVLGQDDASQIISVKLDEAVRIAK